MTRTPARGIYTAALFAVVLHAVLFMLARPSTGKGLGAVAVAPNTSFLGRSKGAVPTVGSDPRVVGSPVLFSLPSSMGFSRELMGQDVETRLVFSQPVEPEHFLSAKLIRGEVELDSQSLMIQGSATRSPSLPNDVFQGLEKRPSAPRVTLAPVLKQRIVGGVVLPQELNQEVAKSWEIRAEISVSDRGRVKHVFLNQPLESEALNFQIIKLLYGLEFNPGQPVDGLVEIYSPESKPAVEAVP